jgi:hypothetical protein
LNNTDINTNTNNNDSRQTLPIDKNTIRNDSQQRPHPTNANGSHNQQQHNTNTVDNNRK